MSFEPIGTKFRIVEPEVKYMDFDKMFADEAKERVSLIHTAFFGDGEKNFTLTPEVITELERKTGHGIGALYARFMASQFHFADIIEIIRLGLIGGGTAPAEAQILIDAYAKPRPIMEIYPLAFDILESRWSGNTQDEASNG